MTLVWFESLRPSEEVGRNILIRNPDTILQCFRLEEVTPLLEELEKAIARGYFAAGFLCYEAGFAFLPNLPRTAFSPLPLAWFAVTRTPQMDPVNLPVDPAESPGAEVQDLLLDVTPDDYVKSLESIRSYIECGHTYQVNFTMRYRGRLVGSPPALYRSLRKKQSVSYAAYIETQDWAVVSL